MKWFTNHYFSLAIISTQLKNGPRSEEQEKNTLISLSMATKRFEIDRRRWCLELKWINNTTSSPFQWWKMARFGSSAISGIFDSRGFLSLDYRSVRLWNYWTSRRGRREEKVLQPKRAHLCFLQLRALKALNLSVTPRYMFASACWEEKKESVSHDFI